MTLSTFCCSVAKSALLAVAGVVLLLAFGGKASATADLTDGLLAHWQLDETSGSVAADSSTSSFDLTLVGTDDTNWVTSSFPCDASPRSALQLNGTDEFAWIESSGGSLESASNAITGWVKFSTVSERQGVFAGSLVFGEGVFGYGLYMDEDAGEISFVNSLGAAAAEVTFVGDQWLFVAGSFDATTGDMYIRVFDTSGTEVASASTTLSAGSTNYLYAADVALGAVVNDGTGFFEFNDLPTTTYDDLRVYDRPLTEADVTALVQASACSEDADEDNDGVEKTVEDAAPNSGDANNDGTADSAQAGVTALVSKVSNEYIVLESDTCSSNDSVVSEQESLLETEDDDSYDYPAGLLDFSLSGCTVGGDVQITQHYYGDFPTTNLVARKYNPSNNSYTTLSNAIITPVTVGGKAAVRVAYTVTDGGPLDADGIANGVIVDPVGLGQEVLAATGTPAYMPMAAGVVLTFSALAVAGHRTAHAAIRD